MRIIIALCFLVALGCKPSTVDVDGLYIAEIAQNVISFENGKKLDLNVDNGAKTIYLVRHAEKDTLPSKKNPILTKEGYERSFRLANMFKQTRIDAAYSTFYNRTMHTIDSLTTLKGLSTKIYQPKDMKKTVEDILSNKSENAIIISGHSNSTPAMASVFMGEKLFEQAFDEDDYDNLLVVNVLPDGDKKLYKLRYK